MKRFAFLFGLLLCHMLLFTACQGEETTALTTDSSTPTTTIAIDMTTLEVTTQVESEVDFTANIFPVLNLVDDETATEHAVFQVYENNYDFYQGFCSLYYPYDDISKYSDLFFKTHFLIAIPVKTVSSVDRPHVKSLTKPENLSICIGMHTTENQDDESWNWIVLLELFIGDVPKDNRTVDVQYTPAEVVAIDTYNTLYPERYESKRLAFSSEAYVAGDLGIVQSMGASLIRATLFETSEQFLKYQQDIIHYLTFDRVPDLSRYDEAFFEDHILVALIGSGSSGSMRFYVKDVIWDNETLTVLYGRHLPTEFVTTDTCLGFAFVILDKPDDLTINNAVMYVLPTEIIGDAYYELYPRS